MNKITRDELLTEIKKRITHPFIIGIDGGGGSGKSTLADFIKINLDHVTIIHMDDFYYPASKIIQISPYQKKIGADFDWKRLLIQVLLPASKGINGAYQKYDWQKDMISDEFNQVPNKGVLVVEGCYSIRKELKHLYNLKIWVDTPRDVRLQRGLNRDGAGARTLWEKNWMVAEDIYVKNHRPIEYCDYIIDGLK